MKTKAVILCAGHGTRMGDLVRTTPKPLLSVAGQPILSYIIRQFLSHGIKDIGINISYQADAIINYFEKNPIPEANLHFIREQSPSGTAGGLKKFSSWLKDSENFFVIYGDILTDQNPLELLKFHQDKKALASIFLHERTHSNSRVTINSDGLITDFKERPSDVSESTSWVNSAIYCFHSSILNLIPEETFLDLPKDTFPKIIERKGLYGLPIKGHRVAIDSPERLNLAHINIEEGKFNFNFLN